MRTWLLVAGLVLGSGACAKQAPPAPLATAPTADAASELATIDAALRELGELPTGDAAGRLYEKRADRLLALRRNAEAKAAYLEAARAYGQSPEATNGPVLRANEMRKKAEAIP